MVNFSIEHLNIGETHQPVVIPEMGINHNGSLEAAFEIVDAAYRAGAKILKHQTHIIEDEMSSEAKNVIPGNSEKSIYEVMKECALGEAEERELMQYVQSKGMVYLSTPFSRAAALRLEKFGVSAFKIGSGEMNNYPLIDLISKMQRPMIISTGMNNMESIQRTVEILNRNNCKFALLHTTNLYPTPAKFVRLGAMTKLREFGVPIGLSDHTTNNNACIAAMALGASVVERHFTDTMDRAGNDIVCSMDENELKELLNASNEVFQMRGGEKVALAEEQVTIDFAFATVVSIAEISAGQPFTNDNIWVKRPGTGEIKAIDYEDLIGKKATVDIKADTHISWGMVE
ncbi:polyhydroxyalkanoate biosynthesis repressor PhaR [Paenibacillus taichungensis]|uniref:Polyhydroxyalkanoate biosynthesis repressor PhaR n=1 Tax=Paenibacillus taichungensis TaxID=484184 RepID=A0A329QCJ3_9BACL|nr:N-acetylneuraminate synthase family protein [Paenibacillus taichungensis]RAW09977.1 polyhydroxyalkanoate biosynthesis repressor PhaR [Paenibacillus taichungensis]